MKEAEKQKMHASDHCHDLNSFELRGMIECGQQIRSLTAGASSMQGAADILVRYFQRTFISPETNERNCVLVRCFKTHRLGSLPEALRAGAARLIRAEASPEVPCLTLLASAGDLDAWNDPASSKGHSVIPLESAGVIARTPMIAQLLQELGIEFASVMKPDEDFLLESDKRAYGVFHVENAVDSPSVPAQQGFVLKYGVRSVLGFGGLLPSGDLFSIIIFSRVPISREAASLFRTLALSVKLVLLPFARGPVFASDPLPAVVTASSTYELEQLRSEIATLRLLVPALEAGALHQTGKIAGVIP